MTKHTIISGAGQTMGAYEGRTPAEALAAMHRDAGYSRVGYDAGADAIVWPDDETRDLCGDLDAWTVRPVEARYLVEGRVRGAWDWSHVVAGGCDRRAALCATEAEADRTVAALVASGEWDAADLRVREVD